MRPCLWISRTAPYNAGPANIAQMRAEAKKRGLDPDRSFNNVEIVTAQKIGRETNTYVRNIYKYSVSYKLSRKRSKLKNSRTRSRRRRNERRFAAT